MFTIKRLSALLLVLTLILTPTASALAAPTAEERLAQLEQRLAQLERALALTRFDVVNLAAGAAKAVVSIYMADANDEVISQGTGFFVAPDGRLLTNAHVVADDGAIKVKTADGVVHPARKLMVDAFLDVAVLQVDGSGYNFLALDTAARAVGEPVMVIGNAWGYSNSVTAGVISGIDRPDPYHLHHYPSLQTDAAINHGNSGGPILDADGKVVAMATWTELKGQTEGIAFGIPAGRLKDLLEQYSPVKGMVRPWLGVAVREPYWSRGGLPNDLGLPVSDVHPDAAAARAGLQRGDWILAVGTNSVNYLMELRAAVERYKPGQTVTMTVQRLSANGRTYQKLTLNVTFGEYSADFLPEVPPRYDPDTDDLY